jgi:hypothetical protein
VYGWCNDRCLVSVDGVKAEEFLHFISDLPGSGITRTMLPLSK